MRSLVLALMLLAPSQEPPQDEGVYVLEAGVGFLSRTDPPNISAVERRPGEPVFLARSGSWAPFQVLIENRGEPIEGVLHIEEESIIDANPVRYRKRVKLGARSRKRVSFPVFYRAIRFNITFVDDRGSRIDLNQARSVTGTTPHKVDGRNTLVLFATESRGNLSHFLVRDGVKFTKDRFVVPMDPARLPTNVMEYHGVNAVVLDDIPADSLHADQVDALAQFVGRGGMLFVSLFRNADALARGPLSAILPGTPSDVRNLDVIPGIQNAGGTNLLLPNPVAMQFFRPKKSSVAWDAEESVLLHHEVGRGVVIAAGFPLSARFLETWPGSTRLMALIADHQVVSLVQMPGELQTSKLREELAEAMKDSMVKEIPPFQSVLWILIAYCLVVAILPYAVFRRVGRQEFAWGLIFVLAIGGGGAVYFLGLRYLETDSYAHRIGIVEGADPGAAKVRNNFWSLFSVDGARYDLVFEEDSTVPFPFGSEITLGGRVKTPETMSISYDSIRIRRLRTYTQDSTLFETADRQKLPGRIEFRMTTPHHLLVEPDSKMTVSRMWLAHRGLVRELRPGRQTLDMRLWPDTGIQVPVRRETSRLLVRALVPLTQHLGRMSIRRKAPTLLYLYEGSPALDSRSVAERGYDFGILKARGWTEDVPTGQWSLRRITKKDGAADPALYTGEGVEYLWQMSLPPQHDIASIEVSWVRWFEARVQWYNWKTDGWERVEEPWIKEPGAYIHITPLGTAYARMRFRMEGATSNGGTRQVEGSLRLTAKMTRRTVR